MPPDLQLLHVPTADEARYHRDRGFCPVECSFGHDSVVDDLVMDHHGSLSHLEPVSLRAYRDFSGHRQSDPCFVVTGAADADATFAIAALAGLLPAPGTPDFSCVMKLAATIARADMNPFAERWEESPEGVLLLAYKQQMQKCPHDAASFEKGVKLWVSLITVPPADMLATVQTKERERVRQARQATVIRLHPEVAFVECPAWGWDVWYAEIAPVIVAYQAQSGRCSIGCRDEATATRLFGPTGLLAVAEKLEPPGWGGRETIIGSPRDRQITRDDALRAGMKIASGLTVTTATVGGIL